MKSKYVLLTALLGVIGCAVASAADFATEVLEATFKLSNTDSTATCFFVRRDLPDQSLYLVTAAHVLEGAKGDTAVVVLRERQPGGTYKRRDHTITIRRDGRPLWARHAKEDIAVLRLPEPPPVPVSALPLAVLADESRIAGAGLHICSPLFSLTYPETFEANEAGFAVARSGIIASHPFVPIQSYHTYLADFTTFSGDSGGPVFVAGGDGRPLVTGVVLGKFLHDERVKTAYEERTVHHPFGLGIVLHTQYVRDTIEESANPAVTTSR